MAHSKNLFAPVGRFFSGVASTLASARELQDLMSTPESVFRARGTTRDSAVRAAIKRM